MKLGIGTANFNMKYGLRDGKISKKELTGIKKFISWYKEYNKLEVESE